MLKKFTHQALIDWWRNMAHSTWHKMSCGAAQRAKIFTFARNNEWRRKDKFQKNHDRHEHNSHKHK